MHNGFGCDIMAFRNTNFGPRSRGLRVVYEQSAENRSVRHGIHLKRVFWNERLTAGRSYSFVDLGRGAGSQGLLSVDKIRSSHLGSPEALENSSNTRPAVSAGRVRARKIDWDHVLQRAIAKLPVIMGFISFDILRT
jgi:hypothetical protein